MAYMTLELYGIYDIQIIWHLCRDRHLCTHVNTQSLEITQQGSYACNILGMFCSLPSVMSSLQQQQPSPQSSQQQMSPLNQQQMSPQQQQMFQNPQQQPKLTQQQKLQLPGQLQVGRK